MFLKLQSNKVIYFMTAMEGNINPYKKKKKEQHQSQTYRRGLACLSLKNAPNPILSFFILGRLVTLIFDLILFKNE